jgi:hypothetical protein
MARIVITTSIGVYQKGQVLELSAAEVAVLGAAARATTFRDQTGESAAVSD